MHSILYTLAALLQRPLDVPTLRLERAKQGKFLSTWAHTLLPTCFNRSGAGVPASWYWLRKGV